MRQEPSLNPETADDQQVSPLPHPVDQLLQDYRQKYGLSADPFGADPYFPFFTGGERREIVDQVIHIYQFGQGMPVVLGERGIGKTRLALAITEALGEDTVCFISAVPTLNAQNLLQEVAQHFGVDPSGNVQQLSVDLGNLNESTGDDGLAMVVIDNAHDLDDATLIAIENLVKDTDPNGSGVRPVLIGDLSLASRLQALEVPGVMITDCYLEAFSLAESVDYLNFRMEMADYLGPEMFTEETVEPWWRQSHGQLAVLHRYAQEHLLEAMMPPLPTRRPFPVVHIIAIAVLGGAVLMTLLYAGDKGVDNQQEIQSVPINAQQLPPQVAPTTTDMPPAEQPVAEALNPIADESLPAIAEPVPQQVFEPVPETVSESRPTASAQPVEEKVLEQPSTSAVATPRTSAPAPSASVLPDSRRPVPEPKVSSSLSADEEMLLSWQESDYTLQLLGVSNEKAARDYIARQPNRDDLLMFKTTRQGKDWFVVIAGRYRNAAAARSAVSSLPPEQAKAGPWARELKGIQKEIER